MKARRTSISALIPLLRDQKPVIERVRQDTRSIRESCSLQLDLSADADRQASPENYSIVNSSIGDEEFSFDDEIINAFAYRNAIKRLASKAKTAQQNAKPDEHCILDEPLIDLEELSQTVSGPRIKSTAISNDHSLNAPETFTHTAFSDTIVEDLKLLLPTSIGSPNQRINERHAECTSLSYLSRSTNDASANQKDKNREVETVIGQLASDDVHRKTQNFHSMPQTPAPTDLFRPSSQSTSTTADAVENLAKHEKGHEGTLAHASHQSQSLLIEEFGNGKKPNVQSRPSVPVRVNPSAPHKSQTSLLIEYFDGQRPRMSRPNVRVKVTPSTKRQIEDTNDRKSTDTREKSPRPHSTGEGKVTDGADDKSISPQTSAVEGLSLAHRYQHLEVEKTHKDQYGDLSGQIKARQERYIHLKTANFTSMSPDSMLKGEAESLMPRWVSPSTSSEAVIATDTLKTPSGRRSRNFSRERLAHKAMEKLAGKLPDINNGEHKRRSKTRRPSVNNEQLAEDVKNRQRKPSEEQMEEEVADGAVSSIIPRLQPSPRQEPSDKYSFQSGTSKSSINANPKLLETVENAIRRLIMPELETLKQDQKMQKGRQNLYRDSRKTLCSGRSGSHTDLGGKLSEIANAQDVSGKPKVIVNRDEQNTGVLLSGDSIEGGKESRRDRTSDSPSRRNSERNMSEKTVTAIERDSPGERGKQQGLKDATTGGTTGGVPTAAALRRHDRKQKRRNESTEAVYKFRLS